MLCYLDDLINTVGSGQSVDVNYLDCEKAFDRIPRGRLLVKLQATGIEGSVLGPCLFLVYINDLVNNLESSISLFVDGAKIYIISSEEDVEALQRDMERLDTWSDKWLLIFDTDKCKSMHIGHRNHQVSYRFRGSILNRSTQEKDLGIVISSDLKSSAHVAMVTAKANSCLGIIKRNFAILNREILVPFYLSLVRPILDYGVQA
ncbi:uncharacterized protein LOC143028736 [Oratosquilla oratoria]|uniref:uncharacterized protein LOC143028736 n=1 Tax=Oratosquilla oratoria TaxID=337810 RepID=UPI003F76B142